MVTRLSRLIVYEDMCSENSGEPADAPLLTIQGMIACSSASIPVQKNVVLHIHGLGFNWPKQKKGPGKPQEMSRSFAGSSEHVHVIVCIREMSPVYRR